MNEHMEICYKQYHEVHLGVTTLSLLCDPVDLNQMILKARSSDQVTRSLSFLVK